MKRSGNDMVRAAVGSYLRRRHYIETEHFRKSDLVLSENSDQMAIAAVVEKDTSRLNSIIFSSINNDIAQAEQQFIKLKTWITELSEDECKNELTELLFPLFCHLYLEIVRGGHRQAISKFLKRHQEPFVNDEQSRELMEELSSVSTTQDIDNQPLVKAFRSCKYEVKLSSRAMASLKMYLAAHSHVILLQVLQTWFDLEVLVDDNVQEDDEDSLMMESDEITNYCINYLDTITTNYTDDKEMRQLKDAIRAVHESPTPSPPLLLYSLHNSENTSCANIAVEDKLLAVGYLNSEINIFSLSENKLTPEMQRATINLACDTEPIDHPAPERRSIVLRGHCDPLSGVAFVPNTEVLLSVSHDKTMRAWHLSTNNCAAIYRGHNYPVWCVGVDSLGVCIGTGSHDRTARLWNLDRTYPLRILAGHTMDVNCIQFHPNGKYVVTGSTDKSVRMWSVTDGVMVRVFAGHTGSVQALSFSPNGQYLASAGDDRHVRVWDLAAGAMVADLRGHTHSITAVDWSIESNTLASSAMDGTVLFWNAQFLKQKNISSENADVPAKYSTNCSSILTLQYLPGNNLVAVGTASTKPTTQPQPSQTHPESS